MNALLAFYMVVSLPLASSTSPLVTETEGNGVICVLSIIDGTDLIEEPLVPVIGHQEGRIGEVAFDTDLWSNCSSDIIIIPHRSHECSYIRNEGSRAKEVVVEVGGGYSVPNVRSVIVMIEGKALTETNLDSRVSKRVTIATVYVEST